LRLAAEPVSRITRICITHFHGDHCLGLPGVLQRLSLDRVTHPVEIYFPEGGREHFEHLRSAAMYYETTPLHARPLQSGDVVQMPAFTLTARALDHPVDTLGWRLEEPPGRTMLPDRLAEEGIRGADIARLIADGRITADGRTVHLGDVSVPRTGQRVAFIMDTALCAAAFELAEAADLLICEATFLSADADLARAYGHLTAADAARIAAEAGARRLVLTHFSQRYRDVTAFEEEARAIFPDVVVARDLDRIPVPSRRRTPVEG
jgi:ribonuclease Z